MAVVVAVAMVTAEVAVVVGGKEVVVVAEMATTRTRSVPIQYISENFTSSSPKMEYPHSIGLNFG